jgi:phage gp36-like protein
MWRAPTTDDLRDAMLEDELLAWQAASVADGKDPAAKAIENAVGVFRSALRSGYSGVIGVASTLPHDLVPPAMHVAAYYFLGGRGGAAVSDARTQLYRDAIDMSRRIADGRLAYTDPDDAESAAAVSQSFPSPAFIAKTRLLDRDSQEGI